MNPPFRLACTAAGLVTLVAAYGCMNSRVHPPQSQFPVGTARDTTPPRTISDSEIAMLGGPANATGVRLADLQHVIYSFALANGNLPSQITEAIEAELQRGTVLWGANLWTLRHDLWNREFRYTTRSTMFELRSAGEDGRFATPDDVIVVGQQGRELPCFARVGSREIRFTEGIPPCSTSIP
jgi:hypothetical protein